VIGAGAFRRGGVPVVRGNGKVVVLCGHFISLIGYSRTFNELGYYSVSLCSSSQEVLDLLRAGRTFEYLVFDAFDIGRDAAHLERIAGHGAIGAIVLVADVNSQQRRQVFHWAKSRKVPLLGVLQVPLRLQELHEVIGCADVFDAELPGATAGVARGLPGRARL